MQPTQGPHPAEASVYKASPIVDGQEAGSMCECVRRKKERKRMKQTSAHTDTQTHRHTDTVFLSLSLFISLAGHLEVRKRHSGRGCGGDVSRRVARERADSGATK